MAEPQSPFDQDDDAPPPPPPPRRPRRPWWRWNVVTLLAALFVLAWVRELGGFSLSLTWLWVFTLLFLWGAGPLPFVERVPYDEPPPSGVTIEDLPARRRAYLRRRGPNMVVRALRTFSLVMMGAGLLYAAFMITEGMQGFGRGMFRYRDFGDWLRAGAFLAMPLLEVMAAGILYVLTVIAERLESLSRER